MSDLWPTEVFSAHPSGLGNDESKGARPRRSNGVAMKICEHEIDKHGNKSWVVLASIPILQCVNNR